VGDPTFENERSPKMKTINEKVPQPIADYFQAANAHQTGMDGFRT
jgi:hypothetical protein